MNSGTDRLLVDWVQGATIVLNIDGVLLGFIVLVSSGTKFKYDISAPLNFAYIFSFIQPALMAMSMIFLVASFILALIAIFGLYGRNQHGGNASSESFVYEAAVFTVIGTIFLMFLVFVTFFGVVGLGFALLSIMMLILLIYGLAYGDR